MPAVEYKFSKWRDAFNWAGGEIPSSQFDFWPLEFKPLATRIGMKKYGIYAEGM